MADEYFVENLGAVPFGLSVRSFKNFMPAFIAYPFACYYRICDRLGWRSLPGSAFGPPGSGTTVTRNEMPARAMSRWAPTLERLGDLGFRSVSYTIGNPIGARESAYALFLDQAGSTLASLEWLRMEGDGIEENSPLEFNSYGAADPETMTGVVTEKHLAMASVFQLDFIDAVYLSDKHRVERVYHQHQDRIRSRSHSVFTLESALDEHRRRSQRRFDWLLAHHVIRQLSAAEIERVKQRRLPDSE